jgi:hypothetical protein
VITLSGTRQNLFYLFVSGARLRSEEFGQTLRRESPEHRKRRLVFYKLLMTWFFKALN